MSLPTPMLAKKMTAIPTGPGWWMEPKYDGWRVLTGLLPDGTVMWTRTGNHVTQVPYLSDALARHMPPGTIVDGEVVDLRTGRQWNRTQKILGTTKGGYQHQPTSENPALTYVLFDVLTLGGCDVTRLPLRERRALLERECDGIEQATDGELLLIPTQQPSEEGLEALVQYGFEGVIVKHEDRPYQPGSRRGSWGKIKPNAEVEAVCTGVYDAEPGSHYAPVIDGKPRAWAVGGICFRVEHANGQVYDGRAAGMDDGLRRELHDDPSKFEGLVVELVHWGVFDSGALRHPNVRRFRSSAEKPAPTIEAKATRPRRSKPRPSTSAFATEEKRRIRNYGAMSPENLLASLTSLRERSGEAYERCMATGSGDPAGDLVVVERKARERGLI